MARGKDTWGEGYARPANSQSSGAQGRAGQRVTTRCRVGTMRVRMDGRSQRRGAWGGWGAWACLVLAHAWAATAAEVAWLPSVSVFRGEFHRFSQVDGPSVAGPGGAALPRVVHAVSRDMVGWRDPGGVLPTWEPSRRILGVCSVEDASGVSGLGGPGRPVHGLLALMEGDPPALHGAGSHDGRTYVRHGDPPMLRVPGASGGPGVAWHAPTARWILGVPVRDGLGSGMQFHASSNLVAWTVLGRTEGDFLGGGLAVLPGREDPDSRHWILMGRGGGAWAGRFDGERVVGGAKGLHRVRGDMGWSCSPVLGMGLPGGRWLVVGEGPNGSREDEGFPWQASIAGGGSSPHVAWEPSVEGEWSRRRSRLYEAPRQNVAATNVIDTTLPGRFELRFELPSIVHHRITLRMSGDAIEYTGEPREMRVNGAPMALPPRGAMERWVVVRTPRRLEVVAGGGLARLCVVPRQPQARGPLILERPGGAWVIVGMLAVHELREPDPGADPGGPR